MNFINFKSKYQYSHSLLFKFGIHSMINLENFVFAMCTNKLSFNPFGIQFYSNPSICRDSIFDVDVIPDADDEETSVKIVVGRYRFSIEPENFYTWEEKISEMLGSRDSDEFVEWIQEALGFK